MDAAHKGRACCHDQHAYDNMRQGIPSAAKRQSFLQHGRCDDLPNVPMAWLLIAGSSKSLDTDWKVDPKGLGTASDENEGIDDVSLENSLESWSIYDLQTRI